MSGLLRRHSAGTDLFGDDRMIISLLHKLTLIVESVYARVAHVSDGSNVAVDMKSS